MAAKVGVRQNSPNLNYFFKQKCVSSESEKLWLLDTHIPICRQVFSDYA